MAVSGLVRSDGAIAASRVDPAPAGGLDLVRGVSQVEDGGIRVGTTRVSFDARPDGDSAGRREVVVGRWDGAGQRLVGQERRAASVSMCRAKPPAR